jgi:hypothetical protein
MTSQQTFRLFPERRMYSDFSLQIWAVGWLAVYKGILWIATEPPLEDPLLYVLGIRHLALMIPFVLFGIGIWNLRRWAMWGLILVTALDLAFFLVYPEASAALYIDRSSAFSTVLTAIVAFINGPVGDIAIFFAVPAMAKETARKGPGAKNIDKAAAG